MSLNASFVGWSVTAPSTYLVGREKVREFALAVGETSPLSHDLDAARNAGHRDLVAPPTFPVIVGMRNWTALIDNPELGLDFSRVVHGEQRFVYERPLIAGDEITITSTIEAIRAAAGNDMLSIRDDIADLAGALIVRTYSLLVARGTAS